ncbi:MFS transporter [Candidatus Bathyarchaeota archaeon]|nr:MFS transporter [Candidatus Bathyarchaeota archaeon]
MKNNSNKRQTDSQKSTLFSHYRGLSKETKYLIISLILPSVAFGMFFTDISYFLTVVQGLSSEFMGIIITTMGVSAFVGSIPLGIAADKYGKRKTLIIGNIVASLAIIVFALSTNPIILIIAALLEGISEAASLASASSLLAEKCENIQRNGAFALYGFAQSLAFGVGSFTLSGVSIFESFGFNNQTSHLILYIILGFLGLFSTLLMLKIKESKILKHKKTKLRNLLPVKSKNVIAKYVTTSAIIAFGAGMVVPLMTYWLKLQYGVSDAVSGPILGISSIIIALSILPSPYLAKKLGTVRAIVLTQAASIIFLITTPLQPNYILASAVYTTRAFLMNMATPLAQSMIMGLVTEDERGAASGINVALWRLPNALSTTVGASLMGAGFLGEPFFISSIFYSGSIILFWLFFNKTKMPEEISCE